MITNLPYLKSSFFALAPYLPYTYNKYHQQNIMNDQSPYFTNYKQRLYNYLQSMKIVVIHNGSIGCIDKCTTPELFSMHNEPRSGELCIGNHEGLCICQIHPMDPLCIGITLIFTTLTVLDIVFFQLFKMYVLFMRWGY